MKDYVDEDSSQGARVLMLSYVILSLIICGGSVFGFTPLKDILLDEGVYEDVCGEDEALPCNSQLVQLDGMFTLAASLFSAYLMPAGLCLRFLGPRTCFLTGFGFVTLGSLSFARASPSYFTLAYVLIGTGNPLLYISAFNFSKLYPKSSNLLLSIFIGCFGFSSVVFFLFHILHFEFGFSSREIFLGFSGLPILLGVVGLFVLPPDPYHLQREKKFQKLATLAGDDIDIASETTPLRLKANISSNGDVVEVVISNGSSAVEMPLEDQSITQQLQSPQFLAQKLNGDVVEVVISNGSSAVEMPLRDQSITQQLQSPQFLAQTLFFSWGMLHQNFYLATIGDQIFIFAGDDSGFQATAAAILKQFSLFYPVGCIVAILPVGALVRNCTVVTSLFVYCIANLAFSCLALVPNVDVQWATSGVYVMVRVAFFTVMSTYSATIFGFKNLGTMFGCAGCCAGLFSLLGAFLSDRALHIDHSFYPVNLILLAGAVVNFGFPIMTASRKWQKVYTF